MTAALRAVGTPRPAHVAAAILMLSGLLGAVAVGNLMPAGDAAGIAVRGGWRPLAWAPDASMLLASGDGLAAVDRAGRVRRLDTHVTAARWFGSTGARLALAESSGTSGRLVVRDGGTGPEQELVRLAPVRDFDVSADGRAWAAATTAGLVGGGYLANLAGTGRPASDLAVAPDGSVAVFRFPRTQAPDSGVLAVSETAPQRLTVVEDVAIDEGAPIVLSPSGDAVAVLGRLGGRAGLVVVPLEPRAPASLVVPDATGRAPAWSPDGRSILVARSLPGAGPELVVATLTGAGAQVVPLSPGAAGAWLDAGTTLAVEPGGRLVRASAAGSARQTVGVAADPGCVPVVAPDGTAAYCGRDGAVRLLAPR